jgi:hypothetical protein
MLVTCTNCESPKVVDAACFASHPEKSVTLTIMALAMGSSEHLAEDIRLGNA